MKQSRIESGIEIFFNYLSGFVLAYLTYRFIIMPNETLMGMPFWVTTIFTVISVARSYFWRRFFNAGLHKIVHKIVGNFFNGRGSV